jgi:hypothetical protein
VEARILIKNSELNDLLSIVGYYAAKGGLISTFRDGSTFKGLAIQEELGIHLEVCEGSVNISSDIKSLVCTQQIMNF